MRVHADEGSAAQTSAIPAGSPAQESTFEGSAVDVRSTTADSFDYSYFLVLALGIAGLVWVRRQSQSL